MAQVEGRSFFPIEAPPEVTAEGAPWNVRAAVGVARTPDDRLATIRNFYPDARPYGDDNFIFTDETGQTRLYNPEGLDIGDVPAVLGEAGSVVGGTLGAIGGGLGGSLGGGVGAIPGVALGAGAGANLGREMTEYLVRTLIPESVDTRSIPQKITDQSLELALGATGEGAGRYLSDAAGTMMRNALLAPGATERMRDAVALGISPRGLSAEIGGQALTRKLAAGLGSIPSSANVATTARKETLQSFEDAVSRRSHEVPVEMGSLALREGQEKAASRFQGEQSMLQQRMYDATSGVEAGARDLNKTRALVDQWEREIARSPNTTQHLQKAHREASGILEDAELRGIPFRMLREKLTDITQNLKEARPGSGYTAKSGQAMTKLESAMRDDARALVTEKAPDAVPVMREHDEYVRRYIDKTPSGKSEADYISRMGATETDNLYNWALSGSRTGAERLKTLRAMMPEDTWETFGRAVLAKMGHSHRTGEFSVNQFVTNWGKMTESARRELFGDRYEELARLASLGGKIKEAAMEENVSKTGQHLLTAQMLQGTAMGGLGVLAQDPVTASLSFAGGVAIPYGVSRALTGGPFQRMSQGITSQWLPLVYGAGARTGLQYR